MNFNALLPFAWLAARLRAFRNTPARSAAHSRSVVLSRCCLLLLPVLAAGCGGSGGANNAAGSAQRKTGTLQVAVNWPDYQPSADTASKKAHTAPARLIPANAAAIRITIQAGTASDGTPIPSGVDPFTVTRNDPNHSFILPIGTFPVLVEEFDGSSTVALATNAPLTADALITIKADIPTQLPITPNSTISKILAQEPPLTSNGPVFPPGTGQVTVGGQSSVTATPMNDANQVVPVPVGAITYSSDQPAIARIDDPSKGVVTGVKFGHALITARLTLTSSDPNSPPFVLDSKPPVDFAVSVKVNLTPAEATLAVQSTISNSTPLNPTQYSNAQMFTAVIDGDNGAGVTWDIVNSSDAIITNGGTIVPVTNMPYQATYTAPNSGIRQSDADSRGTYYVRARSKTDNVTSQRAKVTVLGGKVSVTVQ